MKRSFMLLFIILFSTTLFAQNQKPASPWKNELSIGIGLGQVSYSNWTRGGEEQLSWTFNLLGSSIYEGKVFKWTNALKINYGQNKTGNSINKVTQNDLLFNSMLSYKSGWVFDYFAGLNLITQIAPGYNYDLAGNPQVNTFFDPADITESAGLVYSKGDNFKTQLGVALHQVVANTYYAKTDDPTTTDIEKFIFETGIESITTFRWDFMQNAFWETYLRFFSAFDRLDTWDVRWDNTITGKVNSLINVNLTWTVIYDVRETLKTQVKEALQVGISYRLL